MAEIIDNMDVEEINSVIPQDEQHKCLICDKYFTNVFSFEKHVMFHQQERSYPCDVCLKTFHTRALLNQHYSTHMPAKEFACDVCDKRFNRMSSLISHSKIHSSQKPYKCHLCPRAFHQKGNLRSHLYFHANERPYRCLYCPKRFNQQSNVTYHVKKMHPEIDLSAEILQDIPRSKLNLSQRKHPIIVEDIDIDYAKETLNKNMLTFAILILNNQEFIVKIVQFECGQYELEMVTEKDLDVHCSILQSTNSEAPLAVLQIPIVAIIQFESYCGGKYTFTSQPLRDVFIMS